MSDRNSMFVFSSGRKSPPMSHKSSLVSQSPPRTNQHELRHPETASPQSSIMLQSTASSTNPLSSTSPPAPAQQIITALAGPPRLPGFPLMKSSSASNVRRRARKSIAASIGNDNVGRINRIVIGNNKNNQNQSKERKRNHRYGQQAVELDRLKRENAVLTKKLTSTEKRCQFLQDSRHELQAVAETNHLASIQAEASATRHSSISSTLAVKYKNVQQVLNLVREEYDAMVQETEQKRVDDIHLAGSIEEISANIRQMIVYDTICILKLFKLMDLNGDGDLERHEIVKAITFRKEVKSLIAQNPRITVALKPEKIAKAMKKMDVDGDRRISVDEFVQFTLDRIADGALADAPNHVKAMVMAEGGLDGGGSQMYGGGSGILGSGGLSAFGSSSSGGLGGSSMNNKKPKESRRTAEKAYKNNLMLILREKNSLERELTTLKVVQKRNDKRIVDLEAKVTKGMGEIKRLRTMYKTAQKQIKVDKGSQSNKEKLQTNEDKEKAAMIIKKQQTIKEQLPLDVLLQSVFHREPELIRLLMQAREDNDMEEVTVFVVKCRLFLQFSQTLNKCMKYESICSAVLTFVPNMMECERAYLMLPKIGESDDVWTILHRGGSRSTVSQQHVGVHGKVQHTAQPVMIEDVDLDGAYDAAVELEGTQSNISTRCMLAVPVLYDNTIQISSIDTGVGLAGGRGGLGGKNGVGLSVRKAAASGGKYGLGIEKGDPFENTIPPSFDPDVNKSHEKPMIGVLEMLNKKIRAGHGLDSNDLQMKASSAVFSTQDIAFCQIACKSISNAITRVRNLDAINAQLQYLKRLSNMSSKLFKKVLVEQSILNRNRKSRNSNRNSTSKMTESVGDEVGCYGDYGPEAASPQVVLPVLEDLVMDVLTVNDVRLFVNEPFGLRKDVYNPLNVNQTYQEKLEKKLQEQKKMKNKTDQETRTIATASLDHQTKTDATDSTNNLLMYSDTESDAEQYDSKKYQQNISDERSFYYYENVTVREEDGGRTTFMKQKWGPIDGTYSGIMGVVVRTRSPVYVPNAYNNSLFNGSVDMSTKGVDMICCPIMSAGNTMLGVLQISVGGATQLDYLALTSPPNRNSNSNKYGLITHDGVVQHKGRRGGSNSSPLEAKISSAVSAAMSCCKELSTVLEFYKHIYASNVSMVLNNEKSLIKLFKLWNHVELGVDLNDREEIDEGYGWLTASKPVSTSAVAKEKEEKEKEEKEKEEKEKEEKEKEEKEKEEKEKEQIQKRKDEKEKAKKEQEEREKKEQEDKLNKEQEEKEEKEEKERKQEEERVRKKKAEQVYDEWCEVFDPSSNHNYYQNLLDENESQWELPEGFDPEISRKRLKLLLSCGSISDLPHGLALLVATRKIQSVYRAKQARQRMRGVRAQNFVNSRPNSRIGDEKVAAVSPWVEMYDAHSGYAYWFHSETHETTWDDPKPQEVPTFDKTEETNVYDEWCEVFDPSSNHNYYQNLLDENKSQWELPEGFDPEISRKRLKLLLSCGSISDLPHGLALLVATRKIQSVYRAKQARQRMRGVRAQNFVNSRPNSRIGDEKVAAVSPWVEMYDAHSGYAYWFHSETHETTWDDPKPQEEFEKLTKERVDNLLIALNDAGDDIDTLVSITSMIPEDQSFDIVRRTAKQKLDLYQTETSMLRHNQQESRRGSLRPDHTAVVL